MSACPCGSGRDLNDCCAPLHAGKPAPTAEALMRSRYTAFVLNKMDYLDKTATPEMREESGSFDPGAMPQWLGLQIIRTVEGGPNDDVGMVEFTVQYKWKGQQFSRHELSDFRRVDGAWLFSGSEFNPGKKTVVREGEKTGRNDPCPCGSQKKYKKCCGA